MKILSIWEGTNYIQADLVRDKLGFGRHSRLIRTTATNSTCSSRASITPARMRLRPLFDALRTGADRIAAALDDIARDVQDGHTHRSQFYTRFLEMFGVVTSAWVLLESATIAARRLDAPDTADTPAELAFYRGKLKSARYYANVLPVVDQRAAVIAAMAHRRSASAATNSRRWNDMDTTLDSGTTTTTARPRQPATRRATCSAARRRAIAAPTSTARRSNPKRCACAIST